MSIEVKILDHGYVKYVEHWGSDERIIEAARQSTGGGFVSWEPYEGHPNGDMGLLSFLHRMKHTTPFEMCGLTMEVQAPIFVFREWHRHRTQSYSEMSARYAPLPNFNYVPTLERTVVTAGKNKQAGAADGAEVLTEGMAENWLALLKDGYAYCERLYQFALSKGVPKELARLIVPVGRYSRMRASANLLNWFRFLSLRMAPDAQQEIGLYACAVGDLIARHFPRTWSLFAEVKQQ